MTAGDGLRFAIIISGLILGSPTLAQEANFDLPPGAPAAVQGAPTGTPDTEPDEFAVHGQATLVEQLVGPFHDPYSGANSLTPRRGAETFDTTLFLGARLWSGAEMWINPEIDQGFGLNDTLGLAGFSSGAAYKLGRSHPYWRLPRLFVRQAVDLGGEQQAIEADANQFAARPTANRLVFTIGKFAVPDVFDNNDYAHDPRHDFLNWTAIDAATFDYAADPWGFTWGAAVEWYDADWTVRAGAFDLSIIPNNEVLDADFHEFEMVGEVEHRHEMFQQPGKLTVTVYDNHARMALLSDAIELSSTTGENINDALVSAREYRSRTGVSLGLQQQLLEGLGLFARAGKASGNVEVYEFTDVDQSVSAGLSLKGSRWQRVDDTIGLAAIANSISGERERFLNDGGLGILVGDGRLPHPRPEQILETYYDWGVRSWLQLTADYQFIANPAYNSDRGPVSIFSVRLHAQF
jgi:high affinity Mn2+ porin